MRFDLTREQGLFSAPYAESRLTHLKYCNTRAVGKNIYGIVAGLFLLWYKGLKSPFYLYTMSVRASRRSRGIKTTQRCTQTITLFNTLGWVDTNRWASLKREPVLSDVTNRCSAVKLRTPSTACFGGCVTETRPGRCQ